MPEPQTPSSLSLHIHRVGFDGDGRPVRLSETILRADRAQFFMSVKRRRHTPCLEDEEFGSRPFASSAAIYQARRLDRNRTRRSLFRSCPAECCPISGEERSRPNRSTLGNY